MVFWSDRQVVSCSVKQRVELAQKIAAAVRRRYESDPSASCGALLTSLLAPKPKPHRLGQGSYGHADSVYLKDYPEYNFVIKTTKTFELGEPRFSVLASALVEANVVPHFCLTMAHLHCEKPLSLKSRTEQASRRLLQALRSRDGQQFQHVVQDLKALWSQKESPPAPEHLEQIRQQWRDAERQLVHLTLRQNPQVHPYGRTDTQAQRSVVDHLQQQYATHLAQRSQQVEVYEILFMERVSRRFIDEIESLREKQPTLEKMVVSCTMQICLSILSFNVFFGLVHNDTHLGNLLFDVVPNGTHYVYKVGPVYLKVPLYGRCMKLIDWGLVTDQSKFEQPPNITNRHLYHWCPGGQGEGPAEDLECSFYARDLLDLFDHLRNETFAGNRKLKTWIEHCGYTLQKTVGYSASQVQQTVLGLFHPEFLKTFDLPPVITFSNQSPTLTGECQTQIFDIVNRAHYIGRVQSLVEQKLFF